MTIELMIAIFQGIAIAATPLIFAALGELIVEKSGVLNLGVEGLMIIGAVAAFATTVSTGSFVLGILAGCLAGAALAALFGILTLNLLSNQVATGLALTLMGLGLSSLFGQSFSGLSTPSFPRIHIPLLSELPVIGPLLFAHDVLVYLSIFATIAVTYFLNRTRAGLILRAVGENHDAAHAIGYGVIKIRFLAVLFGGAMAGLGGAYLSVVQTPLWAENMTAGRGWIALALVVFATWKPGRVLFGAYLFGGITIMQIHAQGFGIDIPSQFLSMLPYLATILVLVAISRDKMTVKLNAPSCLGRVFHATS